MQPTLTKTLNVLALLMVVGCVFYLSSPSSSNNKVKSIVAVQDQLGKFGLVEQDVTLPISTTKTASKARKLSKGKGSSYYDDYYSDCIPLYPTPAPSSNGYRRRLLSDAGQVSQNRKLAKGSKSSKGKSSSSAAPSFFCSDAPTMGPSESTAPTSTIAPSGAPSISSAPSCFDSGKGKGKGSSLFEIGNDCVTTSKSSGKGGKGSSKSRRF